VLLLPCCLADCTTRTRNRSGMNARVRAVTRGAAPAAARAGAQQPQQPQAQPHGIHWWQLQEQRTRAHSADALRALRDVAHCFDGAVTQAQLQEQAPAAPVFQNAAALQDAHPLGFNLLTAAALLGGWWQPAAEADGGAGRQAALRVLREACVPQTAELVDAVTR
jgi:hypothetical protein